MERKKETAVIRVSTGVGGLDEVLHGGLVQGLAYLARGGPGAGKTTLGFHFLGSGVTNGEKALFITLGEPEDQLRRSAKGVGLDLEKVVFLDLAPTSEFYTQDQSYDLFSSAEIEHEPITQSIREAVERHKPARIFIDSLTQFRYLSTDPYQFRKQTLSFIRFLIEHGATVLFTSEGSPDAPDNDLQFMCDGVINLNSTPNGRIVQVSKYRSSAFRSGSHSMKLTDQGMSVYPRLIPEMYGREFVGDTISSGVPELDELMHGGLERSTITLITGPSGVGKTTLGMQFMKEAAGRGERSVAYIFEEGVETLLHRCEAVNIPARTMIEQGTLLVAKVEPLTLSPDELASMVRREVEENDARVVMIDSISGYRLSLRSKSDLVVHVHALAKYLAYMGVTVILIAEVEAIASESFRLTDVGISYLADNVVFMRYLEMAGHMTKAIGVIKKRTSDFQKTIRQLDITSYGIKIGEPLTNMRGLLKGTPESVDTAPERN